MPVNARGLLTLVTVSEFLVYLWLFLPQLHVEVTPEGGRLSPPLGLFWRKVKLCSSAGRWSAASRCELLALHQGLLAKVFEPLCEGGCRSSRQGLCLTILSKSGWSVEFERAVKRISVMFTFSFSSFSNPQEVKLVMELIRTIKEKRKDLGLRHIGIITPYSAQKKKIQEQLDRVYGNNR